MGLLFFPTLASNTWRKPLQLIDCWLPEPRQLTAPRALPATATATVRRFARAGWLHGTASVAANSRVHDGRIALAGSIDEVCRELDRLTALDNLAAPALQRKAA